MDLAGPRAYARRHFVLDVIAALPTGDKCILLPGKTQSIFLEDGSTIQATYLVYREVVDENVRPGTKVYHFCNARMCIRPSHLFVLENRFDYLAKMMHGSPLDDACVAWPFGTTKDYPSICLPSGDKIKIHKAAFELAHGPVPAGLCVLHRCDNTLCFRVSHLFLGTHDDNMDDMAKKGRAYFRFGLENANARLTAEQVVSIAKEYAAGGTTIKKLSAKFDIHMETIRGIVKGTAYRDVPR